ncbi:hypothetical protein WK57_30475 [Burkholderia ubonensis]|uniref:Uncharacterized protein n=1 Tax=Burkholderia ubonensis TaxID=101571 RepID=A0AA40R601_9BURK|nr:hypothetical protein [Burkholderia ubonensis]KWZ53316.1 hypothetical protein WK57_30475 [Burkholderia ubonensis]
MYNASTTSFLAYVSVRDDGTVANQQAKILALLRTIPATALSRLDIANLTGIRLSSVCARIAELRDEGLVFEPGTRRCPHTGKTVKVVQATPDLLTPAVH